MHHGSPADPDEFLFATTPQCRFDELAGLTTQRIVTVGHSHSQFHRFSKGIHFINPGSVGRMFDGKLSAACAVLTVNRRKVGVALHRIAYSVEAVVAEIERLRLPAIYSEMYRLGRKLN
jgi:diadenosine tetraphosphatase ApaH/serine/threonine PP2A family protein phosphatase